MKSYGVCVQHLKKKRQLPIERVVRSSASVHDGVAVLEGLWSEACILFWCSALNSCLHAGTHSQYTYPPETNSCDFSLDCVPVVYFNVVHVCACWSCHLCVLVCVVQCRFKRDLNA